MTPASSDSRILKIHHWLTHDLNLAIQDFSVASSDASFRRYFRVKVAQQSYIVMDAPPDKEDIKPFVRIAQLFASINVNTPAIIQQHSQHGFLLLEDFGQTCLLDVLNADNMQALYTQALNDLVPLQTNIDLNSCELPYYDQTLLQRELDLFSDWFLKKHCQLSLTDAHRTILNSCSTLLIESALNQTQVCVHRDYHSRNLMHIDDSLLGMIDFQDAVIGAITYDAVSLLKDCYINWSDAEIERCLKPYYQQLINHQLIDCDFQQFQRDFDLMGLQRHLKAIGIFARLNHRDHKAHYLADIPRTLNYVLAVSQKYPELQAFHHFLTTTVLPIYQTL